MCVFNVTLPLTCMGVQVLVLLVCVNVQYSLGCVINVDGKVELRTLSPGYDEEEMEDDADMQQDPKEKMTYTEQAAKRTHCQRLTR